MSQRSTVRQTYRQLYRQKIPLAAMDFVARMSRSYPYPIGESQTADSRAMMFGTSATPESS